MSAYAATEENATKIERAKKLLRVALDPSAREGEALNAGAHFVKAARRDGILADHIIGVALRLESLKRKKPLIPAACRIRIKFGKYTGLTLREIGEQDIQYLQWLSIEFSKQHIRQAAQTVLAWLLKGGAP